MPTLCSSFLKVRLRHNSSHTSKRIDIYSSMLLGILCISLLAVVACIRNSKLLVCSLKLEYSTLDEPLEGRNVISEFHARSRCLYGLDFGFWTSRGCLTDRSPDKNKPTYIPNFSYFPQTVDF